ncbi:sensor domain-containing protein [Pseudoxanthomonas daejeonensis]|uniref:PAS domain S-box protein n=1 Tax=Pseudoxanthomonas daejeonensis TaxID=266062 RepID=A0ABQ6ZA13_9GAMM|nr:EAL domain-containing protein [Pseudoxanthomonas daejeonensis]KAF1696505.1 PAS domain S-box protein [Pseudoxanthomonas daejeonensis]
MSAAGQAVSESASLADPEAVLAALERALREPALQEPALHDRALPHGTRLLLQQAHDALSHALAEGESARVRYHALFDAVPDPVSVLSETGIVLDLNKAGIRAYHRSREEIIGQPIETLNPDLPPDHLKPVWETINRGETYVIEVTNMRGDGSRFPVEVHSAGFEHAGRRCIVAVARDLSGRWQAESRYRLLMESIDKGVLLLDRQFHLLSANPAAHRILGPGLETDLRAPRQEWTILDEHGRVLPEDQWPAQRSLRSGQIIPSTVIGLHNLASDRMVWISATTVPVFSSGRDEADHVFVLFSDITDLKRDSTLFDRAQSLAHIGGWEWDRGRQRMYLTGEAMRIVDLAPGSHAMDDLLARMRSGDRIRLEAALERVFAQRTGFDLELQGQRGDGHAFWIRMIGEVEPGNHVSPRIAGTLQDITERKQAEETLRIQARTDPLTGILNRDAILGELDERLREPAHCAVAVLYIDLDRFKTVNDVLGHAAGDDLLVRTGQRIAHAIGTEGLLARFGGDEFLVLCDGSEPEQAPQLADKILQALTRPFMFGEDEFMVGASIGIAYAPADGTRPQQLIQSADIAMYDCKRRSRNGWQVFTPDLAQKQQDRLQIETQLRRALDNAEFRLVYQPQVDLRQGRIVAAEALIRWQSHQLGELRPDLFISHAETTGDIVRIGDWVLRAACRQVREWQEQGLGIIRVAVNVSYRQFVAEDLAVKVAETLREFDLPGSALELEFTERVLIEDAPATLRTFAELRRMGVMLTIDDFGEGYSALNYLRRLPIHGLKLSQLFVEGVPENRSDVAVCEAVSAIARSLGLGLVAEGVEQESQRRFLLELGVPVGQGFLFAPGLPPDELARRLANYSRPA